jgi:hypothetical protein
MPDQLTEPVVSPSVPGYKRVHVRLPFWSTKKMVVLMECLIHKQVLSDGIASSSSPPRRNRSLAGEGQLFSSTTEAPTCEVYRNPRF